MSDRYDCVQIKNLQILERTKQANWHQKPNSRHQKQSKGYSLWCLASNCSLSPLIKPTTACFGHGSGRSSWFWQQHVWNSRFELGKDRGMKPCAAATITTQACQRSGVSWGVDLDGDFGEFETSENMLEHVGTKIRWSLFFVPCYGYARCMRSRVQKDGLQMPDVAMLGAVVTQAGRLSIYMRYVAVTVQCSSRFPDWLTFTADLSCFCCFKCKLCFGIAYHHLTSVMVALLARGMGYDHLATSTRYGDTCCASCGSVNTADLVKGTGACLGNGPINVPDSSAWNRTLPIWKRHTVWADYFYQLRWRGATFRYGLWLLEMHICFGNEVVRH